MNLLDVWDCIGGYVRAAKRTKDKTRGAIDEAEKYLKEPIQTGGSGMSRFSTIVWLKISQQWNYLTPKTVPDEGFRCVESWS